MKRSLLLALAAVAPAFLAACEDRGVPTEPEAPQASSDISDGAHDHPDVDDNPHFFWLPPMVPEPSFSGTLEDDLLPTVRICPDTDPTPCGEDDALVDDVAPLTGDHYHLNWKTDRTDAGETFRIWALVGSFALGFADADVVRRSGRDRRASDALDAVTVRAGATLPIRFRIEQGALCPETDEEDCAAATVSADEETTVAQDDGDNITFPAQESGFFETEDGLVKQITVVVEPCGEGDDLPIDLPLFGECLKITTDPKLTGALDPFAVVSICTISLDPALPPEDDPQEELLTLHRYDPDADEVFALPHADENCPEQQLGSSGFDGLLGLAEGGWRTVRDALAAVLGPRPLHATTSVALLDVGGGGETELTSSFQFALPAKMEVLEGDGQTAEVGTEVDVPPAVHVTDARGGDVAGARITFTVTSGDGSIVPTDPVLTDESGIAQLDSWTLGPEAGTNTVTASGRGIADPVTNGPQVDVFDPFWPDIDVPEVEDEFVLLQTGEVVFTAEGEVPGDQPREGDIAIYKNYNAWGSGKEENVLQDAPFEFTPDVDYFVRPMSDLSAEDGIPEETSLLIITSASRGDFNNQITEQRAGAANLEVWVRGGGWLVIHAGDNSNDDYIVPGLSGPVDETLNCTGLTLTVSDHALIRGPDATLGTDDDLDDDKIDNGGRFCYDNHGSLSGLLPEDAEVLMIEEGGDQRPVYATYLLDAGRVIVTTLTLEFTAHTTQTLVNHFYWAIHGTEAPAAANLLVAGDVSVRLYAAPGGDGAVKVNTDGSPRDP